MPEQPANQPIDSTGTTTGTQFAAPTSGVATRASVVAELADPIQEPSRNASGRSHRSPAQVLSDVASNPQLPAIRVDEVQLAAEVERLRLSLAEFEGKIAHLQLVASSEAQDPDYTVTAAKRALVLCAECETSFECHTVLSSDCSVLRPLVALGLIREENFAAIYEVVLRLWESQSGEESPQSELLITPIKRRSRSISNQKQDSD